MQLSTLFLVAATCIAVATPVVIEVAAEPGLLQQRLCNVSSGGLSSTTLLLSPGNHTLQLSCIVNDVVDLEIVGEGDTNIVCPDELTGGNLIFLNITNMTIRGVLVENCGRVLPLDLPLYVNNTLFFFDTEQKVAVLFAQVTNLFLFNMHVTRSFGFGITGINLRGDVELHNVNITNTDNYRHPLCYRGYTGLGCSGSGALFLYSDLDTEDPAPTTLMIRKCFILNNENVVPRDHFLPVFLSFRGALTLDRLLITGATGLGMYLGQRSYTVDVNIVSSSISQNRGYASGLAFLLFSTIRNTRIEMEDCTIRGNEGSDLARGGGMLILVITYIAELGLFPEYPDDIHNLLLVRDTTIAENFANIGGGGYFYFSPQNVSDYRITYDNVTFDSNKATIGAAIEVDTRPATFLQKSIHFLMVDVTVTNNGLPTQMVATTSENSAAFVLLNVLNVTVVGQNHTHGSLFANNSPGPFLVVGGHLYLKGKIDFINNTALRGGALSLYDYALLFIHEGSRINFIHNSALQVGGAIHASSPGTGTAPTCVFQVIGPNRVFSVHDLDQLDLSLKFVGNSANDGGNSVYVNPLYGCASLPESSLVDISVVFNTNALYSALFQFESSVNNSLSEISSIPENVCLCFPGEVIQPRTLCVRKSYNVSVVPGERFTLQFFPVDLILNPVSSILLINLNTSSHNLARGQASFQLNGGKCTTVDLNVYGPERSEVSLILHTQQGSSLFLVNVMVNECPLGYILMSTSSGLECGCDPYVEEIGSICNFTTHTVSRRSNSWLGVLEHVNFSDVVYVYTCPTGFCNSTHRFVDLTVQDQLCISGRTGILCGACHGNLSVVFGSPECMECSNFWLFTIFIYAVAGIILIVLLFALNFTVSHGSLNGISVIFYANLVSANSNILFSFTNRGFLFIWVSLLNLELGFPLCFYDGMTEAVKAGLQCVFPIYLLCMSLGLIVLSRWSRRIAKLASSHGIQVLATLIYLSFSKMLRYVIDILSFATLNSEERNHIIWLFDGNLEYFTGAHTVIAIVPATITFFFITFYMFSLIFIKQIEKYTIKLKPLMDAYGGPFKDQFRFWFGLRLLVLSVMYLTIALISTDDPVHAALIQQVFLVFLMILQAFLRPFKSQLMNALDLFFLLNLFFLLLHTVTVLNSSSGEKDMVVNFLVGVAFVLFVILMMYHVYCIPRIKAKLGPRIKKLKEVSWSNVKTSWFSCCLKAGPVKNDIKLTSMVSVVGEVVTDVKRETSSTVVSLENSLNADKVLQRAPTYSRWRDSTIGYDS